MSKPIDVKIGDTYARLTVISEPVSIRNKSGKCERFVKCKCSCGVVRDFSLNSLRMNLTTSCGCYNKEMISKRKISDLERVENSLIREYKHSAKQRNITYNLSDNLLLQLVKEPCNYCNSEPFKPHREDNNFLYNGLDRIDNNIGYLESNVVPCCFICNKMKGVLNEGEFMEHLNKIFTRVS